MRSKQEHLAARWLRRLADVVCKHPRWMVWPQFILAGLCIYYTVNHLQFDTSRDNLVGGDKRYHHNFLQFKKEFPVQDDLVVIVESGDREKNRQFVERLGALLEADTNYFTDVVFKGDLKMLGSKALLFVPTNDLVDLKKTLQDYAPFLHRFSTASNFNSLLNMVNTQFRTASREDNAQNQSLVQALPALHRIIQQATDNLNRGGSPPAPGMEALFSRGDEAEGRTYVTVDNGRIYLVSARAANSEVAFDAIERLRSLVAIVQQQVSGVNVGVTGEPILEMDEMLQSQQDTTIAAVISLLLVAVIFVTGYHETGRPLKASIALLVGLSYTMAFTTAVIGHLNILTITFAPILIGLAIDFGVHLVTRYEEDLRHGASEGDALHKAIVFTGQGIFTGAFTTAGAFLAMAATDFRGIQEMGIICGGGLLICLVPMMTLLPALLLRGRQNVIDHTVGEKRPRASKRARLEQLWLTRPRRVVSLTIALCIAAVIPARNLHFDYNLLHMQSETLPAVVYEMKLVNSASKSLLFGAVVADSLEEAVALERRLTNLPSVASADLAGIEGMSGYLTEDQTQKLQLVTEIKRIIAPIRFKPADAAPVNLRELNQTLWSLYGYLSLAISETRQQEPELYLQLQAMRTSVAELRHYVSLGNTNVISRRLGAYQRALFTDIAQTFETLRTQDDRGRLTANDLPPALKSRFLGVTGKYLLQVYPKKDVWQRQAQEEFVEQLRQVEPNATGTPVQLYEYTGLLKSSYQEAALYSLGAIVILVLLHFRSFVCVVLALLPVGIGSLWLAGFMGIFDIALNPANIMTLPLIIGIGVTNGIHILNRYAEEQNPSILAKSTGKAVIVSGLTTIAGFGSLIFAKHRGIESLGFIMSIGTATCLVAGIAFLPALLNLLGEKGWKIKKPSGDNAQSTAGSGGTEVKPQV